MAHREQSMVYMFLGEPEQAILSAKKAVSITQEDPFNLTILGLIYAMAGEREQAMGIIRQLLHRKETKQVPPPEPDFSMIFVALNDNDKAFEYLEQAYETHNGWLFQLKVDPAADKLRSDPRYAPFLRKIGLEP